MTSGTTTGTTTGATTTRRGTRGSVVPVLALTVLCLAACGDGVGDVEPLGEGAITAGALAEGGASPAPGPDPTGPTGSGSGDATGGDPGASGDTSVTPPDPPATPASPDDAGQDDAGADDAGVEAVGLPPRPAVDACVTVPVPADGVYTVYEAGTAVVTLTGGALVLGHVQVADGWTVRVDEQGGDEVEVDFRRQGEVLDLQVEVDDGGLEPRICSDDD